MILHVLDFDRGDTHGRVMKLSLGLTVTSPQGHTHIYDHQTLLAQADVLLLKHPCITDAAQLQFFRFQKTWPQIPKLVICRIAKSHYGLLPNSGVYLEKILDNGLHFMGAIYESIERQRRISG